MGKFKSGLDVGCVTVGKLGVIELRVSEGAEPQFAHACLVERHRVTVSALNADGGPPIIAEFTETRDLSEPVYAHEDGVLAELIRAKLALDRAIENMLWTRVKP
ncbi:MAG: hypothetical protein IPH13_20200 [Planctomycetes bacterium]|nr:hypothetical protein [Planctomycetota bacterium]